ncbi:PIG-L deacetylase family protein [Acidimangrovimonas pyrenivorans]|uniref:PIG-L deacetylase family protein n=1 Tax=Acidimangrovimonas pyrenivorans TaxID=2030798 RepID=A0ABV7AFX4_9RHOB
MAIQFKQPLLDVIVRRVRPGWLRPLLLAYERFGPLQNIGLPAGHRLSVIAPHPDDESIGCGGLIALWAQAGRSVEVIFLTQGEQGSRLVRDESRPLAERQAAGAQLRATRRREATAALARLGAEAVWCDGRDGALQQDEGRLADRLAAHWQASPPDILAAPFPADRHADHAVAARIASEAAATALPPGTEFLAYEVWSPLPANALLDITPVAGTKWQAIAEHASQTATTDYVAAAMALNTYRARSGGQAEGYAEAFHRTTAAGFAEICARLKV